MSINEKVEQVIYSYESKNPNIDDTFLGAKTLFDNLVKKGVAEKRGNQLEESTQRTNIHVKFNYV